MYCGKETKYTIRGLTDEDYQLYKQIYCTFACVHDERLGAHSYVAFQARLAHPMIVWNFASYTLTLRRSAGIRGAFSHSASSRLSLLATPQTNVETKQT